jgi:hypothetical protein
MMAEGAIVLFNHQQLIALLGVVAVSLVYLVRIFFANTVIDGGGSNNTSLPLIIYGCITLNFMAFSGHIFADTDSDGSGSNG